ncbi:hypothetical protein MYSTI_02300 [Myxococcus stipitatus DSM 14675]|uniref:Uncharacterized protein n=1 Tax=Myxococcus stipitatus (strain DSM 14675 / JCM 12634 / Mx s8) TaxID=1278073 RepID=L7U703_MYXSD|nr:hypothetical protein MYSTI_02300 [Myxococcus stipitatus DSM 14675]
MAGPSPKHDRNAAARAQSRFNSGLETLISLYAGGLISLLCAIGLGWLSMNRAPLVVLCLSLGLPLMIAGWKVLACLLWGRAPRDARPESIGSEPVADASIPFEMGDVSDLPSGDASCGDSSGGSSCNE